LVTSANLTPGGLDHNFEYGICFEEPALVHKIKSDLEAYARLGNVLSSAELESLLVVAQKLKNEYEQLTKSTSRQLKADFNRTLHHAQVRFLSAQVGKRLKPCWRKRSFMLWLKGL
jgi:phosphatidylserine/phosphatidylglycerophosphate/cardiolipin synthase-like enzyme